MGTEQRLIDANKLVDKFWQEKCRTMTRRDFVAMVDYAPTIEARPVVHGQWVGEADGYADGELVYDVWYCSECNFCIDDGTDDPELLPNYCENCGADMRGADNG